MVNRSNRRQPKSAGWIEAVLTSRLYLSREMMLFLFFSVVDLLLTIRLLWEGGHVEVNPVARFFLYGWGLKGLVYFKFALVALVCTIAQIVAVKRLDTARRLLGFAVVVMAGVATYSSMLYLRAGL